MKKQANVRLRVSKSKKRKGIHSKSKTSKIKGSKNYKKKNIGQGR